MMRCPICDFPLEQRVVSERLAIQRCGSCGHSVASHPELKRQAADYHEQYSSEGFLDSLAATRKRQALLILQLIREHWPDIERLLDFGAGRGWFLEAARRAGIHQLAGADSSQLALRAIQEAGFAPVEIPDEVGRADLSRLGFAPQVVTFLDVLEHFEVPVALGLVRKVLSSLGGTAKMVIKVPVSDGLLYRLASRFSELGRPALLERLYQVGTSPPHVSYFSRSSLEKFVNLAGLKVVERKYDRDFEPEQLADRASLRFPMSRVLGQMSGRALAMTIQLLSLQDSAIILTEDRRPRPPG